MPLNAEEKRARRALANYSENPAGNLVRVAAFRECDYTDLGILREFGNEDEVVAFEEARYRDGTGYRVKFTSKPRESVPPVQQALQAALDHSIEEDGNKTRVQLEDATTGFHDRFDGLEAGVKRLLEYHEKTPPATAPDDLQLMARVLKEVKVGRANAILQDLRIPRPTGLKKEDKAALLLSKIPREQLLQILAGPTQAPNQGPDDQPEVIEAPLSVRPTKKQRRIEDCFRCVSPGSSGSTETPDTASVSSDQSELFGTMTANGQPCDNIKGHRPFHAEGESRCESMLGWNRNQRCKLQKKGGSFCCHHALSQ